MPKPTTRKEALDALTAVWMNPNNRLLFNRRDQIERMNEFIDILIYDAGKYYGKKKKSKKRSKKKSKKRTKKKSKNKSRR